MCYEFYPLKYPQARTPSTKKYDIRHRSDCTTLLCLGDRGDTEFSANLSIEEAFCIMLLSISVFSSGRRENWSFCVCRYGRLRIYQNRCIFPIKSQIFSED